MKYLFRILIIVFTFLLLLVNLTFVANKDDIKLVDEIKKDFTKDIGIDISVNIGFLPNSIVSILADADENMVILGICYPIPGIIYINTEEWAILSPIQQKALIYHELGHCECYLTHDKKIESYCRESIMTPLIESTECLNQNWEKYVDDLRTKCRE